MEPSSPTTRLTRPSSWPWSTSQGNGSKDIIYADQSLDRVVVDYGAGGSTVLGDQATGLLSPGAVTLADLNGDGIPDLIVANSGSNNVLIYPGLGNGQFGPALNGGHGYFVGTNPVGITVAKLTGALPDLVVADKGSNQVSILLNQSQPGARISFDAGPRLNSGGTGPVSTVVGYFTPGSAYPDILVSNSGSNNVALLPGVGGGFFNDQNPQTFAVGTDPGPIFVGNFDGRPDLVTVNAGSNDLTVISDFMNADRTTIPISSGGTEPDAAFSFSFPGSVFDNLVVGNGGDGVLALLRRGSRRADSDLQRDQSRPAQPDRAGLLGVDRGTDPVLRRHGWSRGGDTGGPEPGRRDPAAAPHEQPRSARPASTILAGGGRNPAGHDDRIPRRGSQFEPGRDRDDNRAGVLSGNAGGPGHARARRE